MTRENDIVGGRYRIITQIGTGGMSTVYLAIDKTLNKQWAVKEIRNVEDKHKREVIVRSLVEEANLIKAFDHPAIPRIVDLVDEHGSLYVVMDYIEGRTLREVRREKQQCTEKEVVDWGIQLCSVLDYIHRRKPPVVFSDMKPSNVMLKPDGTVMLIDFGIAHISGKPVHSAEEAAQGILNLGTPGYGSPEQFSKGAVTDARSDVYSLGMTLHFLLTGVDPTQQVYPIRQYRPELSEGLEKVIDRAIDKNPDKRYQSCAEFAYALRHYKEEDDAHIRALKRKWYSFVAVLVASVLCAVLGLGALGAEAITRNNSFDYWMGAARQEPRKAEAVNFYKKAAALRPKSIEPFEGMLKRYRADGKFTPDEAVQYTDAVRANEGVLRTDEIRWAQLCYDTGLLYWFYYADAQSDSAQADPISLQYERIRYSQQWMRDAADTGAFKYQKQAQTYADIAAFNTQVVPEIVQGTDKGKFRGYFTELEQLVNTVQNESNEVMRLYVSQFVQNVLSTYTRKFRADKIDKSRMLALAERCMAIAKDTSTTSHATDELKEAILNQENNTRQSIIDGFVDARKVGNNEAR